MISARLPSPPRPARMAARIGLACVLVPCLAGTTIYAFAARGTHDLSMTDAVHALAGPLSDAERKTAIAAVRRQACQAVVILTEEAKADSPAGREAASALGHLREALR